MIFGKSTFPPSPLSAVLIVKGGGCVRSRRAGGECKNKWGHVFQEPVDRVDIV